jgi:hypothetical protein
LTLSNGVRLATLSCHFIPDDAHIVVEGCGAIPDLEDREGEVSGVTVHPCSLRVTNFVRPPYIKLLYTVDWKLSSFWSQRTRMSMHKTPTVGLRCIMHAPRYVARFLLYPLPPTFRKGYLDIVRWLCERGGAAESVNGVPGVDTRSKGGWTPLSELGRSTAILTLKVF